MKKFLFTMVLSLMSVVCVNAQNQTSDDSKFFVNTGVTCAVPLTCGVLNTIMNEPIYTFNVEGGYNITNRISASVHGGYADEFNGFGGFNVGCNGDYHIQLNKKPILNLIDWEANGGLKCDYFNVSKYYLGGDVFGRPITEHDAYHALFITPYVGCTFKFNLDKNKKTQIIASQQLNYMRAFQDNVGSDLTVNCYLGFRYNF